VFFMYTELELYIFFVLLSTVHRLLFVMAQLYRLIKFRLKVCFIRGFPITLNYFHFCRNQLLGGLWINVRIKMAVY
jgi:hypothetical protein